MAKINRKIEKNKTFGGIIHVRELFSSLRGFRYLRDDGGTLYLIRLTVYINEIVETIERHSKHYYIYDYTNICIFIRYNA